MALPRLQKQWTFSSNRDVLSHHDIKCFIEEVLDNRKINHL